MEKEAMPIPEYSGAGGQFHPKLGFAHEWAKLAKGCGHAVHGDDDEAS